MAGARRNWVIKLAKASYCRKKKIKDLLDGELAELSENKSNIQQNSTAKGKKKQKSTSPTTNWGMGESGNIDGDATNLNSSVNREQVT